MTRTLLLLVFFTGVLILNKACSENSFNSQIIEIEGVYWAGNISSSFGIFGSASESEDQLKVNMSVSEGDLIYMMSEDLEYYYRYNSEDGDKLILSFDTSLANSVWLNGHIDFFELSSDPATLKKFMGLQDHEVKQISTLSIPDRLNEEHLNALRKHESSIYGTGLILGGSAGKSELYELLSICRPQWLVMDGEIDLPDPDQSKYLADLELLWVNNSMAAVSKLVNCCTSLESLIIAEWSPVEGEIVPLSGLRKLHSLTLSACEINDLSNFELPPSLMRLHLLGCDTLTDIHHLRNLSSLNSLSLAGCSNIRNPEMLEELRSLNWISFPPKTSQTSFSTIIENNASLEVVEIIACPKINDLSVMEYNQNLKVLMSDFEVERLAGLEHLDQLKLLILDSELFEKYPESVSSFRQALPQTTIVPGSGLCLGSGWLILILPLAFLSYFLFRRKQNQRCSEI